MKIAPEMHQQQFATLPITYVASQEIVVFFDAWRRLPVYWIQYCAIRFYIICS